MVSRSKMTARIDSHLQALSLSLSLRAIRIASAARQVSDGDRGGMVGLGRAPHDPQGRPALSRNAPRAGEGGGGRSPDEKGFGYDSEK